MSDYTIELQFLGKVAQHLQNFKKKNDDLWNCRCPLCNDSEKNQFKTRGYFGRVGHRINYYCHNCGANMPLSKLIRLNYQDMYREYVFAKFRKTTQDKPIDGPLDTSLLRAPILFKETEVFDDCIPISDLVGTHPAKRFCEGRSIPSRFHASLYFAEDFKALCKKTCPDKARELREGEPRVIIPFYNEQKKLVGFQGRALRDNATLRYITMKFSDDDPMIYGLDTVDFDQLVYVVEGPFDSMFLPNAIAVTGSSLGRIDLSDVDSVYVHDNQPRNKQIVALIRQSVESGKSVVIWPETFKHKDINAAINAGMSQSDILAIINNNTFKGIQGRLKFGKWKKI